MPTAVLSTTVKAKERARKKDAEKQGTAGATTKPDVGAAAATAGGDKMDTDEAAGAAAGSSAGAQAEGGVGADVAASAAAGDEGKKEEAKKEEVATHLVENPARVVPAQVKFVSFPKDSRCVG